jgi:hypothetical protein
MNWQTVGSNLDAGHHARSPGPMPSCSAIGALLIYLAIARRYEPLLLLPIGAGCIFANLGMSAYTEGHVAGHDLRFRHSRPNSSRC